MSIFIKFAKFWELQGKDSGVCFQAKLKGLRQSFREGIWVLFQAKLKGFRQGFKEGFFFLRKGPGLAMPSNQVRQGFKERTFRGGEAK